MRSPICDWYTHFYNKLLEPCGCNPGQLTNPIEQQLRSLEGLDQIRSSTYPGQTVVSLSFDVGTNLEESTRQVETAIKKLTLPQGATFKVIPLNLNESAVKRRRHSICGYRERKTCQN
jgi:hypothetical protein